jgi:hypothetical protein
MADLHRRVAHSDNLNQGDEMTKTDKQLVDYANVLGEAMTIELNTISRKYIDPADSVQDVLVRLASLHRALCSQLGYAEAYLAHYATKSPAAQESIITDREETIQGGMQDAATHIAEQIQRAPHAARVRTSKRRGEKRN